MATPYAQTRASALVTVSRAKALHATLAQELDARHQRFPERVHPSAVDITILDLGNAIWTCENTILTLDQQTAIVPEVPSPTPANWGSLTEQDREAYRHLAVLIPAVEVLLAVVERAQRTLEQVQAVG